MAAGGEDLPVSTTRLWRTAALGCLLVAIITAIAWPAPARATTLERLSIEQLSRRATMIVEGSVVSTAVEQTPAGVRTAVRIRVRDSLKGMPSTFKTVYVPGGTLTDGSQVVVDAMASFRPGDACYVFVDTRGWVMGGFQGKLDVAGGRVLGSGETTATMSRRIVAALRAATPPARQASGARRAATEGARRAEPVSFIEGIVSDSTDGHVLSGVLVTCEENGVTVLTTSTDGAGYYRLEPLKVASPGGGPNRWYDLTFSKAGYETQGASVWISAFGSWAGAQLYPTTTPPPGAPTITSITPGEASAGTDTHVTISGHDFGDSRGEVEFSYGRKNVMRISASDVSSWAGTSINCAVPTAIIDNYSASAGSGPVVVTTSDGRESNPYDFVVTFGYGGHKWPFAGATYYVNTSGVDDALRESLVDAGAAVWNAAGSGFTFTDGGPTLFGKAKDGFNVISWAAGLPDGVIGQASSYYDASGNMTEADVQFSNAFAWGTGTAGSGTMDIQTIAMHEIGHWLKLLDQYMDGDSSKVMYGYGSENQQKRALTAGDTAGIQWIYPIQPGDTVGPVCAAKNATVKRGGTVKIYFMVHDALSDQVTMQVVISTRSGGVKKSWTRGYGENYDGWWFVNYKCKLPRGTYRILVTGKDLAANSASKVGRATLAVK